MSNKNESIGKVVLVAVLLSIFFSVVVSSAAVLLKPVQIKNKNLDMKTNILAAAGMLEQGAGADQIEETFKQFDVRLVDLDSGEYVDPKTLGLKEAMAYDQYKAASKPNTSYDLSAAQDIADIKRRANVAKVYIYKEGGEIKRLVLPIHGYGLWSTLYGFIALKGDLNTIAGLGFYQQAETPGLGGEVDNPMWKAKWPGKKVYGDENMEPKIRLVKGGVDPTKPGTEYKVDALSGATLTSRGVTNLLQFWMGDLGFAPYLKNLRQGEV
ncbi:Na(+)-translocating NADH-quinone reductase subunit C [Marinobacteraceae bacterium S3BR75-40.1]